MLPLVETPTKKLAGYKKFISRELFAEIEELSRNLKGARIFMVNSTPRGGGVAEILKSLVPLMKGVGLRAEWYTIPCHGGIFDITKKIHNALQGEKYTITSSIEKEYLECLKSSALLMKDMESDIWIIHDPQPVGLISLLPRLHPSICRLHIDLTAPEKGVWNFVRGFLEKYDKVILSSKDYIKEEIRRKAVVLAPGIDPLAPKNQVMPKERAREILASFGVSVRKPLVSQISRFDIFKDPLGVIKAYKIAKKEVPSLQLSLEGLFLANDDPEAMEVYKMVKKESRGDPDIFLFADANQLGGLKVDTFIGAVQTGSDIILQKSLKEGFALTVAEAMWKGKPVIGGKVGGIKLQIIDGQNGFLVETVEETGKRIVELLRNPALAKKLGREARKTVREKFLMPRVLRDYLKIFKGLI